MAVNDETDSQKLHAPEPQFAETNRCISRRFRRPGACQRWPGSDTVPSLLSPLNTGYDSSIRKALNFLEMKLNEGISDNYTLALVTYALSLAKRSTQAKTALSILNGKSERQGELRFWGSPATELSDSWQPHSIDIELAGYALLSHVKQQRLLEGVPIMKWLLKQRNSLGGYTSTQDTIVALQALSACAVHTAGGDIEMNVTVQSTGEENPFVYRLDNKNRFVLKSKEIVATQPMGVTVSTSGYGFGIFQRDDGVS
ncbi:UNVERIFIED_CONTAM: hypothetical protein K2H54_005395 [Gekko kuhli]